MHATASPHNTHNLLPSICFWLRGMGGKAEDYQPPLVSLANREELEALP